MKKHIMIFILLFSLTIGFATLTTVLDIKGNINVAENLEDFRIELTKLLINGEEQVTLISNDKQSFTFNGSGNDKLEYTVTNYSYQYDANINLICTPNDDVIIEQVGEIDAQSKSTKIITSTSTSEITCTINVEKISRTDYAEEMCEYKEGYEWSFDYTESEQEFIVPCDGNYKLEAWGAQGGNYDVTYYGGYGAYSFGNLELSNDTKVYITTGGVGQMASYRDNVILSGGFNGGGNSTYGWTSSNSARRINISGGGATHFSFSKGLLSSLENNIDSIYLVAAGGGGAQYFKYGVTYSYCVGGHGGGIKGSRASCSVSVNLSSDMAEYKDASQSSPGYSRYSTGYESTGFFGQGGLGYSGGGAGYYGGTGNYLTSGGGSSYIGNPLLTNKSMYCYNCTESNEEQTKTISTTCTSATPIPNCAKQGNGYAKITYLGD